MVTCSSFHDAISQASHALGGWLIWFHAAFRHCIVASKHQVPLLHVYYCNSQILHSLVIHIANSCMQFRIPVVNFCLFRHAYRHHRFVPARTLRSGHKRELRRPENKQIVSAVVRHSCQVLLGVRSRVTKYSLAFVHHFFTWFHGCT